MNSFLHACTLWIVVNFSAHVFINTCMFFMYTFEFLSKNPIFCNAWLSILYWEFHADPRAEVSPPTSQLCCSFSKPSSQCQDYNFGEMQNPQTLLLFYLFIGLKQFRLLKTPKSQKQHWGHDFSTLCGSFGPGFSSPRQKLKIIIIYCIIQQQLFNMSNVMHGWQAQGLLPGSLQCPLSVDRAHGDRPATLHAHSYRAEVSHSQRQPCWSPVSPTDWQPGSYLPGPRKLQHSHLPVRLLDSLLGQLCSPPTVHMKHLIISV